MPGRSTSSWRDALSASMLAGSRYLLHMAPGNTRLRLTEIQRRSQMRLFVRWLAPFDGGRSTLAQVKLGTWSTTGNGQIPVGQPAICLVFKEWFPYLHACEERDDDDNHDDDDESDDCDDNHHEDDKDDDSHDNYDYHRSILCITKAAND